MTLLTAISELLSSERLWVILTYLRESPRSKYWVLSFFIGSATLKYLLLDLYTVIKTKRKIQERKQKAKQLKQVVRETCALFQYENVLDKDINELRKSLNVGKLMVIDVLQAYQKSALVGDDDLNMVTEPVLEALEHARRLDKKYSREGLLFGVPISIAECLAMSGYDRTAGAGFYVDKAVEEDAVVVKVLKAQGAIPFVRTNVSQAMFSTWPSNSIYGQTLNPHDLGRSPGGSSCGEAALVARGGSYMGIGADFGGGIRIPAAFCGCYSLKPSSGRISSRGLVRVDEKSAIQPSVCPISKDFKSLKILCKAIMSELMYDLDPNIPHQPFSKSKFKKTSAMRIGYFMYDGNIQCQPPIVRAMKMAKDALEIMGHTLVPASVCEMGVPDYDVIAMYGKLVMPDRCYWIRNVLSHEKADRSILIPYYFTMLPNLLLRIISFLLYFRDKNLSQTLQGCILPRSVEEYQYNIAKHKRWRQKFTESWRNMRLDAMICPVFPSVAPKNDSMNFATAADSYCLLFSSLDFPVGVMPVATVNKADIKNTLNPKVYNPSLLIERILMKGVQDSEGLPIGIQCAALPYREETCLRVMKEIDFGMDKDSSN